MRPTKTQPRPRHSLKERIAKHSDWLFRHHGIQNVDLEDIAKWAESTVEQVRALYPTIDHLVAVFVRDEILADTTFPLVRDDGVTDPLAQLKRFLQAIEEAAFNNYDGRYRVARIACNLTEKYPKSREVIRLAKQREILAMTHLCRKAGCRDPEILAEKLFLLVEGARWGLEVFDPEGPTKQLVAATNDLIACHFP
jgi:hypothetical protein